MSLGDIAGFLTGIVNVWLAARAHVWNFHFGIVNAAILGLVFVFSATCVALLPLNYAAFSVFLTPTFVLLAEANAGDWHLAGLRIINTLLGGALALVGARLLWPTPEWNRLPAYMAGGAAE